MSPWVAFAVITWVALIVLYLGLAATLRKLQVLGAELNALRAGGQARAAGVDLHLPDLRAEAGGGPRLVLAADTGCPACHMAVDTLAAFAKDLRPAPILLTHEPPEVWQPAAGTLDVRREPDSWRLLAHLSPPILMTVDADGRVGDIALPSTPDDVVRAVASWGISPDSRPAATLERSPR